MLNLTQHVHSLNYVRNCVLQNVTESILTILRAFGMRGLAQRRIELVGAVALK